VLQSHQALEERLKRAVVIPDASATPEQIKEFRRKLGVPDAPEGYKLERPELENGLTYNEDHERQLRAIAHQHGVPAEALRAIHALHYSALNGERKVKTQAIEQAATRLREKLGTERFEQTMTRANRASKLFNLPVTAENIESLMGIGLVISDAALDQASAGNAGSKVDMTKPALQRMKFT
jgi:hypothetical protein